MSETEAANETAPEAREEIPVALAEFCLHHSRVERSVELIGAFHHDEKRAGRLRDTSSAYRARLAEFARQPA